jgi:hypothetical protein
MKVPNNEQATIASEKVSAYLLNAENPNNNGKADFFLSFGFRRDAW